MERTDTPPEAMPMLVGIRQAATQLGCHPNTLRNRIRSGDLRAVRNGHRLMFRVDDLRRSVDELPDARTYPYPAVRLRRGPLDAA